MRSERFLRACRREQVDCTPVWLMRQAGRYMKEYMEIRSRHSFLTMCKTPELAAEVTLQPVDKLGVDAAIIFADILLPLEGMGINLEFAKDEGPVIHNPVRTADDVDRLRVIHAEEDTPYVLEAIRLVRRELDGKVPVIGFSGAPFTLASYMIEGGGSKNYIECKQLMWRAPDVWHALMRKLADVVIEYLSGQIRAGAQAVQVFDSWVGTLSPADYRNYVLPHTRRVMEALRRKGVPVIHFANNASGMLELIREAGGDVIGIDWRIDLATAWERIGYDVAIQGNLDPITLFASPEVIEERVKDILNQAGSRPGHIFNLGHGLHKATPVENVIALVEAVHKFSKRAVNTVTPASGRDAG